MTVVVVVAAWLIGSLTFGLILGRVFAAFARRRRSEEDLFRRIDETRVRSALRGKSLLSGSIKIHPWPGTAPSSLLPSLADMGWLMLREGKPRWRTIQ